LVITVAVKCEGTLRI